MERRKASLEIMRKGQKERDKLVEDRLKKIELILIVIGFVSVTLYLVFHYLKYGF